MVNRRDFIKWLVLVPTISWGKPVRFELLYEPAHLLFERDEEFYRSIKSRNMTLVSSREMRISLQLRPGGWQGFNRT